MHPIRGVAIGVFIDYSFVPWIFDGIHRRS
jgi:hypothetical protein